MFSLGPAVSPYKRSGALSVKVRLVLAGAVGGGETRQPCCPLVAEYTPPDSSLCLDVELQYSERRRGVKTYKKQTIANVNSTFFALA